MITEKSNVWRSGLSSLAKGLARVLPGSGPKNQSGRSGAFLAVFSAFATLSLLFTPNAALAQDANLTVSFGESNYTAIENGAEAMVTVNLSQAADRSVTIPITTSPAKGDFSVSSHVSFVAGEVSRTISVSATDDADATDDSVTLSFGALPTGVSGGSPSSAAVMLRDDDLKPLVVSFGATEYSARERGAAAQVRITLNSDDDGTLTPTTTDRALRIVIVDTAESGTEAGDYAISGVDESGNLVFAPGQSSQVITVEAKGDDDTDNEGVGLAFGATLPAGVTTGGVLTTNVDLIDDGIPTVSFSANEYTVAEGAMVDVIVNITPAPDAEQEVNVSVSPASGDHFTLPEDFSGTVTVGTSGSGKVAVSATEDDDVTGDQTIMFSLGNLPSGTRAGSHTSATVKVTDNDSPAADDPVVVSFDRPAYSVSEGGTVSVRINIDPAPKDKVVVSITPSGTAGSDDYKVTDEVTFAAGDRVKTITVEDKGDDDIMDETLTLTLAVTSGNATVDNAQAATTVSLTDDGKRVVSFAAATLEATEGGSAVDVIVNMTPKLTGSQTVAIPILVSPSSGDFKLGPAGFNKTLTFTSGGTSEKFTVTASDDTNTDDETVTFSFGTLPSASVRAGSTAMSKVTLKDATRPTLTFGASSYIATENGEPATVTVNLDPPAPVEVTVPITATSATADFLLSADELVFPKGVGSQTITVVAKTDGDTDSEEVTLSFGTPTPASAGVMNTGGVHQTTDVTLADDSQRAVSFGTAPADPVEGADDGTQTATVTVELSESLPTSVTVPITVMPASGDFELGPKGFDGTLTFASGRTSEMFTITAKDDDDLDDETVTFGFGRLPVSLRAGSMSTLAVTIQDDDDSASDGAVVSIEAAAYTAVENGDSVTVGVTLDPPLDKGVTVAISSTGDTAAATVSAKKVTFAAGETRQTITVSAKADTNTSNETVTLTLDASGDAAAGVTTMGGQATATVTLVDDGQAKGTVSFNAAEYTVTEGTPLIIKASLQRVTGDNRAISIPITTEPTSGDFILSPPDMLVFASGGTTADISISITDDADVEAGDEMVKLKLGALPADFIPGTNSSTTVTLADNDRAALTVSFDKASYPVEEGKDVKVMVTLSPKADRTVTIPIKVNDDKSTAGDDDYTLSAMEVVFNKGDDKKEVILTAMEDADATPTDETVHLEFGELAGGVTKGATNTTTVTIDDMHAELTVSFGMGAYAAIEGGASAMIMVSLNAPADRPLNLPIATDPKTGPFELSITELMFAKGDQTKTIIVTATADDNGEDDMVTLSFADKDLSAVGVTNNKASASTATVTLVDDKQVMGTVSFGVDKYMAMEGGDAAMVMIKLDPPLPSGSRQTFTIPVSALPMTGTESGDFKLSAEEVTFGAGDMSKTITVTAVDNKVPMTNDGMVDLMFGELPDGITAADPTATTVTLVDDDRNEMIVAYFMPGAATAAEGGEAAMVSVGLDLGKDVISLDRNITLPITVTPSEGAEKADYTVSSTSVTFPAGAAGTELWTAITVTANLDDDNVSETVTLGLGALSPGVMAGDSAGQPATAVVTLEDDMLKALTVSFGAADYTAMEGGDAATVMVSLSAESDRDITIPITATGAEGSEESFELSATEVMFTAGDMSKAITVTASFDDDTEDGMVTLGLGALPAHVSAGDQATAAVTLTDDGLVPLAVAFAAATYTATEGGDAVTVTVRLNRGTDREITIPLTMDPADGPYALSVKEVTFAVGQQGQNVTVTAEEDVNIVDDMVTLGFDLSGLERVNLGAQSTTVVTLADDKLIPVTVAFGAANYTAAEGGAAATVMVSLNVAPGRNVTIPITTDPAQGSFELSADQVTFAPNETSKEITVTATLDADLNDGTVTLGLGDLPDRVTEGAQTTTVVALTDDGLVPLMVSFDAAEYNAHEGGDAATVMVNLNVASDRDVTIPITANPAQGDFEISAMEVMFAKGEMSKAITVTATLDADVEDDMVTLSLGALPNRVTAGANSSAMVTLVDDGLVPVVVSFESDSYTATEGGAAATVTVNLDQDPNRDVTIPITTDPAQGDFELSATEVMFSAGNMSQTITVTATSDDDVDDEMVMLGLGDLPNRVTAGDPATSSVALIDKGYTVTFAQARQTVRESERGTVTANISPAANGQVSIPLSVTHQGGASANDYSGVPGSLAFAGGSSQASFTVAVMADEEYDPGESIDVSFTNLPDKVNVGDIALTTVEFEQFRTPEQFSTTLQAALAVVAGAMGDSAINAIEGRFERYRESMMESVAGAETFERTYGHWSDMESPGLAMSGYQGYSGVDNGFVPMATTTPGTGLTTGSTGYGRSHTSGSMEEAISLGALTSTARPGESVIASGYGMAPNGEQDVNFSGVAFEMAMDHGDEGKFSPVVWVQGDLQRFDGEIEDIGMDFDGGLDALHLGVDLYSNGQTLAGVSLMQSWGDLDYTDDGVDGSLDSSMSTFHPYVYFQANPNLGVWGILGFGSGSVDVSEPDRTHEFDADFSMFAGGVRSVLNRRDNNELGLSADAFMAELSTDAADDISGVSGEAQRARVMVDWLSNSTMEAGQDFSWKAEIGGRFDGGDGIEGVGIEAGFRAGLVDSDQGLDVALGARALLLHENDASDYGIGVQVTWDPGEKRKGMVASLASSYGQDRGGSTSLWDNGNAMNPIGTMWQETQVRVDGEIGYAGLLTPFGLPGTVMPYSRARFSGYGQEFGVGTRWTPAESSSTDTLIPATFELEGLTRETRTGLSDLALVLRMSIPFGGEKAIEPRHSRNRAVNEAAMGPTVSTAYPETETTGAE